MVVFGHQVQPFAAVCPCQTMNEFWLELNKWQFFLTNGNQLLPLETRVVVYKRGKWVIIGQLSKQF